MRPNFLTCCWKRILIRNITLPSTYAWHTLDSDIRTGHKVKPRDVYMTTTFYRFWNEERGRHQSKVTQRLSGGCGSTQGFPGGSSAKDPASNAGGIRQGFCPWVGKIPWSRVWQPTPVFLPGESPWTDSRLAGYSPCDRKELDTIELISIAQHVFSNVYKWFDF